MLLVAVALLSAIATMHFAIHGAEVQVPALQGMTVADARSQTAGLGLNLDVDNRYYSGDVAARVACARGREPGPAKSGRAGDGGQRRTRSGVDSAARGSRSRLNCQTALEQSRARHRAGAGSSGSCAGDFKAQREPACGSAGRRGRRRICDAGSGWPISSRRASATGKGRNMCRWLSGQSEAGMRRRSCL